MEEIENCTAMCSISLALINTYSANVGNVKVINENKKDIALNIKAQGVMTKKLASYTRKIFAENQSNFTAQSENLKDKSIYPITKKTNSFLSNSCKNLIVDKDPH
ncbi:MAG: hypothetical protein IBJ00_06575 [Alphaproteobacteria bacterium]|nr:hypothetical protein [Alphaproteobacteria bacterium]